MAIILALLALLLLPISTEAATNTGWVNIKSPTFGAVGNGSADDTAAIQAAIDYAFAHNLSSVYCPPGVYKTTSTIYLDPPGNLRTNLTSPTIFNFTKAFFGDPTGGGWHVGGCQLAPNFNNAVALMVGTGQSMRVSDISVVGPDNAYRGNLDPAGVGIGLAGGSGGSSVNLVENTYVTNFYTLYMTDANGACCLSDQNTFRKVGGANAYYGINLYGTQAYIDDIVEPDFQSIAIAVNSTYAHQVDIRGGFLSAGSNKAGTFSMTGVSVSGSCIAGGTCVNATITSPDAYWGLVYNSFVIITPHYGAIPLTLKSWDGGTHAAVFQYWEPWLWGVYQRDDSFPAFESEIASATTIYAVERVTVAKGMGIDMYGVHLENSDACTTLFAPTNVWAAQVSNKIVDPFFNNDISMPAGTENRYCQQTFPFIGNNQQSFSNAGNTEVGQSLDISGGNWNVQTNPVIIDMPTGFQIRGKNLATAIFNVRVFDYLGGCTYGQEPAGFPYCHSVMYPIYPFQFPTVARGGGHWDKDYFRPSVFYPYADLGEQSADFCGYEPCSWTTPNLSPSLYALVSGSLGALGSYVPVACRTVFKSVGWNSTTLTTLFLRSASCPGYSWGQNLTDATTGGTVTWSITAGSAALYLDAGTMTFMFPGLGISLNDGGGASPYIVTGVYPYFGYVTVLHASTNEGAPFAGSTTTCSSSCTIGQAAYSWTAY